MQAMKSIKAYDINKGIKIVELRADHQFEPSQAALANMEIELNASVRKEYVTDIEGLNRTIK